ncbi:MAG TPA: FtsX-like permease family protein [Chitinophagales bacterium]|nr:FtsX-like permease family protein [Chitinophagales bacterium]
MIRKIIVGGLVHQPLSTFLNVILLAFGTTIISLILVLNYSYNKKIAKDLHNIDMVVGAKGSPLQLVLSAVYQLDDPTGNISMAEVNELKKNRNINSIIPLAYGDTFKGYKILGTEYSYLEKYNATVSSGRLYKKNYEVVLGYDVALKSELKIGDTFLGNHGSTSETGAHENHPYEIVGILNETESVVDYLIISNVNTTWNIHNFDSKKVADDQVDNSTKELTAVLIDLTNPTALHTLPRKINAETNMQAAIPAIEINRLSHLTGLGTTLLEGIAWSIIFLSALSVFITVYRRVQDRKYELAVMRLMGATRYNLLQIILFETWLTTTIGYLVGMGVSRLGIWILQNKIIEQTTLTIAYQFTPTEKFLLPILLGISTISVIIPLIYVFRLNISKILADD